MARKESRPRETEGGFCFCSKMAVVAQLARASACGAEGCGIVLRLPPQFQLNDL